MLLRNYTENSKQIFNHGALTTIFFFVIVTGIALKLNNLVQRFQVFKNPSPFLPPVEADYRNQFQCLKIFLNNKFAALF